MVVVVGCVCVWRLLVAEQGSLFLCEVGDEGVEGQQVLFVHQVELPNKIIKMYETRVKMRLLLQTADFLEVRIINMRIHPQQPLKYLFDPVQEIAGERDIWPGWEYLLVVELLLHPLQQQFDIFWCRYYYVCELCEIS